LVTAVPSTFCKKPEGMKINLKQNRGLKSLNKVLKLFQIRQKREINLKHFLPVTHSKRTV